MGTRVGETDRMTMLDDAASDLQQIVAALQRELDHRTAERDEALAQQIATSEILSVISRSPTDVKPVFDAIVGSAGRVCEAEFSAVARFENGLFHLVATHSMSPEETTAFHSLFPRPAARNFVIGRAFLDGRPVHFEDALTEPDYDARSREVLQSVARYRSLLGVPILREGRPIGVIFCGRREVKPFTATQIELLETFADQAAIAIENVRLFGELENRNRDLGEALEQQTATAEVLGVINSSPGDLGPVFEAILDKAHTLCGATLGSLFLFDGELFRAAATHGYPEGSTSGYGSGVCCPPQPSCAMTGVRWVHVPDLAQLDDRIARAVAAHGVRTNLLLPLRKDGTLLGVLSCNRTEVQPFSDKQIALLQSFAAQAVIAMDNARLLDEIRRRQAELRVTFDNMGDGVAMFDAELRLAAWNHNFQQILDLPDELLAERPNLADYVRYLATHGEYGAVDVEEEVRRLTEIVGTQWSAERTRPDGRVIEVRHNPVPSGGFVLIYGDITERKPAEAEIHAARDAAEKALTELKTAQAGLIQAEKMASLGQLTAGIAHEIKNPLNFVNNFAGLSVELLDELKETAAPGIAGLAEDERAEVDEIVGMLTGNLEKIAEHGRRADGIVKSMLEHSRGGSGERRAVDLSADE